MSFIKAGFVQKLRICVDQSRREEREMVEFIQCMQIYKDIAERPLEYALEYHVIAENTLDAMLLSAIMDQRKHRKYAKDALRQMQLAEK